MRGEAESAFLEFRERGRPRAMARVFDLTAQELLLVAGNLARSGEEAEELVQQTFLAAMQHRERWDGERPLLPWLLGILLRLQRAERKRRASAQGRATELDLDALASMSDADPVRRAEEAELATALAAAIAALPEAYRDVSTLRLVHGLEPAQIAHALGRPLETVRTQLRRAKEQLREALPRSLAALVVLDAPALDAVRLHVLGEARRLAAESSLVGLGGGVIAMKMVVSIGVLVVGGALWWWRSGEAEAPRGETAQTASERQEERVARAEEPLATPAPAQEASPASAGSQRRALDTQAAELTCHVTWSDGSSATDVSVWLWHTGLGRVPVNPLAISDADGNVRFSALPPGRAMVGGDRGGELRFELAAGANAIELRIPPGILVEGVVLDEHEQPLSGAELWISDHSASASEGGWFAHAGADGRFALRDVEPHRVLAARAPGHAPGEGIRLGRETPGQRIEIALHVGAPGPRLRGVVHDEAGAPIVGALVFAGYPLDPVLVTRAGTLYKNAPPQCTGTDAQGRFEFAAVHMQAHGFPLWVAADGFVVAHEELELQSPETVVDVTLVNGVEVSGIVRGEDGHPLPQVEVFVGSPGPISATRSNRNFAPQWGLAHTWTANDGSFQLGPVSAGAVELVAAESGVGEARETVELVAGQPFTWNATLQRGEDIDGVVTSEQGPLQGLKVSAVSEDDDRDHIRGVVTDSGGGFHLTGAAHASYTLFVLDPSVDLESPWMVTGVKPGGGSLELAFPATMRASARIVAQLVGADRAAYTPESIHVERMNRASTGGRQSHWTEGRLETGLLPPGSYSITLDDDVGRWTIGPFELAAGEVRDVGEFVRPAPGRLEVEVRDAGGAVLSSAEVDVRSPSGATHTSFLIEVKDGLGTSDTLQPGSYVISACDSGQPMVRTPVEIRAGETTRATLVLPPSFERWIQYPPLVTERLEVWMEWRCDGVVLSRGLWGMGNGNRVSMRFVPGHYEAEITLDDGRSATTSFEVDASTTGADQAVLLRLPSD